MEYGCSFLLAQKGTKDALGVAFDERHAGGSAHRRLTPKPPFTGDACLFPGHVRPAVLRQDRLVLLASAHWGLPSANISVPALYECRLLRQSQGSWAG